MVARPEGLARFADKIVLGLCVLVSLWCLSLSEETRVTVASRWAHRLTTPVEWTVHLLDGAASLKSTNEQLRARIASLELDSAQIAAERQRIEELEERAGFYERSRGHLAPAAVLELIVSRIPVQAKIHSFGSDSLKMWQPVVTEKGLVGRIRQVLGPNLALVQLLTDAESRISVESTATGATGLLRYDGLLFLMDHVPQGDPIEVGDHVVTSGLGGTVPRGIPVGEVSVVRASPTELFQHVEVKPAVRFSALSQVYVVVRPGPWYSREAPTPAPAPPAAAGAKTAAPGKERS